MFRRAKGADAGERLLRRDTRARGAATDDADSSGGPVEPPASESVTMVEAKPSRRRRRGEPEPEVEPTTTGPFDLADVDPDDGGRLDLGSLRLAMREDMELRVQVDEASGQVIAVVALWPESAVELRAFAAPKTSGMWDDIRPEIAADTERGGGTAEEADGVFGRELHMTVRTVDEGGKQQSQPQRLWGIDGPRWFLRANVVGRAATDEGEIPDVEAFVRDIVVVRGREAMAPRDALPLTMPEIEAPEGAEGEQD